jgi:hypothetical protein
MTGAPAVVLGLLRQFHLGACLEVPTVGLRV